MTMKIAKILLSVLFMAAVGGCFELNESKEADTDSEDTNKPDGTETATVTETDSVGGTESDGLKGCKVGLQTYEYGAAVAVPDQPGCSSCVCLEDGTIHCDDAACLAGCTVNGQHYEVGDVFRDADDCNDCYCDVGGLTVCTLKECLATCEYQGVVYMAGDAVSSVPGTNCNDCTCDSNGEIGCVDTECVQMCSYNGVIYAPGDTFDAIDGCNTCTCMGDGNAACTEMACPSPCDSKPNTQWFEPGCSESDVMPIIEAGCYQECTGQACETGICQTTDINPCVCDEGMECCEACGQQINLCLAAPAKCVPADAQYAILAGGKSFGECMGECGYQFTANIVEPGTCTTATLRVSSMASQALSRVNQGQFTPMGTAKLSGLAKELAGHSVDAVYGCPDCADGGASNVVLRLAGTETNVQYEYMNPPELLTRIDAFTAAVLNALNTCVSSEDIQIDSANCTPAASN